MTQHSMTQHGGTAIVLPKLLWRQQEDMCSCTLHQEEFVCQHRPCVCLAGRIFGTAEACQAIVTACSSAVYSTRVFV